MLLGNLGVLNDIDNAARSSVVSFTLGHAGLWKITKSYISPTKKAFVFVIITFVTDETVYSALNCPRVGTEIKWERSEIGYYKIVFYRTRNGCCLVSRSVRFIAFIAHVARQFQ